MNDSNFPELAAQIDFLVRRKFGHTVANILRMGGTLPEPLREAGEYHAELSAMRPEDLQALYQQEHEKERVEHQAKADREEAQRFFNQPRAAADFEYWSKCAYWTLDEAIALSLGKAPQIVSWEQVKGYAAGIMSFARAPPHRRVRGSISPFAIQYKNRRELALRAARRKLLSDPVLPWKFLSWAKRMGIDYPPELEKQIVGGGHQIADWKSLHDGLQAQYNALKEQHDKSLALLEEEKNVTDCLAAERDSLVSRLAKLEQALAQGQAKEKALSTRERITALKMIIGMAVSGYAYDATLKRSDKISEIVNDLDSAGVSVNDDTVRKWLKEAADLLPREGLDDKDR